MVAQIGFKQTDVGLTPEDWQVIDLNSITSLMTNGFVGTAKIHYTERENGVLYIQGYNVKENSYNMHGIKYVTEKFHKSHSKSCLRTGDVLVVQTGDIGTTTVVPEELAGSNCHALIILRFTDDIAPDLIAYYFNSDFGRNRLRTIETGTTMKHLNVGDMLSFCVPLPPTKDEQKAIAEALSDVDALIEALVELIAKKRAIKQGAMQELLTGKRRLPGFIGEWEERRLGDIALIIMGQSPSSYNYNDKGIGVPLIQGNADIKDRKTIKRIFTTEITKNGYAGDIIMTVRAPVGEIATTSFNICLGRGVCAIRYPNKFLYYALVFRESKWLTLSKGSTFDSVNSIDVSQFIIEIPKVIHEQTAIVEVLTDMDTEIEALETRLAKTRQLKQGMMQELLTGRIRLI